MNPCKAGDTVTAWSEILDISQTTSPSIGAIRLRLVALKDNLNESRSQWKTASMEEYLNGAQPQCSTNSMEEDLNGRRPQFILMSNMTIF